MMYWQQDHTKAQAHRGGVLTNGGEHHLRRAAVGPFRQKVVLDKPDTLKPHLLGEPYLIDNLPYALVFCLWRGRAGNLYLIEQTEFHAVLPLSGVYNAHIHSSHRGTAMAAPLYAILEGAATNSNSYNGMGMRGQT
jgi:hypothetical protein